VRIWMCKNLKRRSLLGGKNSPNFRFQIFRLFCFLFFYPLWTHLFCFNCKKYPCTCLTRVPINWNPTALLCYLVTSKNLCFLRHFWCIYFFVVKRIKGCLLAWSRSRSRTGASVCLLWFILVVIIFCSIRFLLKKK